MCMKWWNLKRNKCPQCSKDFVLGLTTVDGLLAHECGFKIRHTRYNEIVADMVNQDIREEENQKDYWEP